MAVTCPGNICIGDYINNYTYTVSEMTSARSLPVLVPTNPFPDPYQRQPPYGQSTKVERWPCTMSRPETRLYKPKSVSFYPRPRDWMHDWAEKMYKIGEFGAKQEVPKTT